MKNLEAHVISLEKKRKRPLPLYAVQYEDGTEARLDALDLFLALAQQDAGRGPPVLSARRIKGEIPAAGTAWADLNQISNII